MKKRLVLAAAAVAVAGAAAVPVGSAVGVPQQAARCAALENVEQRLQTRIANTSEPRALTKLNAHLASIDAKEAALSPSCP